MKEGWGKIKKKRKSGEERNSQADRPVQYIKQLDWCTHTRYPKEEVQTNPEAATSSNALGL